MDTNNSKPLPTMSQMMDSTEELTGLDQQITINDDQKFTQQSEDKNQSIPISNKEETVPEKIEKVENTSEAETKQ